MQKLSLMAVAGLQDLPSDWTTSLDSLCKQMPGMVS